MDDDNDIGDGGTVWEKLSKHRCKIPGWLQIKVDMDPIGKCSCDLDRARSHRPLTLPDHDNPHP